MFEKELYDLLENCSLSSTDGFEDLLNKAKTFDVLSKYKEHILLLIKELADDIEDINLIEKHL